MKSRLRACLSSLFAGEHGVLSVSAKLRTLAKFQFEGIQSLRRSFHGSSDKDDPFLELGSVVAQRVGKHRKLKTEKPEHKKDDRRRSSNLIPLPGQSGLQFNDTSSKLGNSSPALSLKLDNQDSLSGDPTNINASNFKSSSSISIENVPSSIGLSDLKEALSVFGKISKASMTSKSNGVDCCFVQFESVESYNKAISVGGITVKSFILPIRPLQVQETITIRISNIGSGTADSAIHSTCMSYGALEGLVRSEDAVDVLFRVKDNSDTQRILKKLNYSIMDGCKWTACLHPEEAASGVTTNNDDTRYELGLQISCHLADLKRQMWMKKVHTEDLEWLHHSLMHLEAHPASKEEVSDSN
ncbi:hypothetical protein CJ030_MR8G026868 [Morella rubra]|uniref:RRM domain-containing protein n=1 Tax=Morella rubra TaxID=262757 RepID=A0A6A1UL78_9ROSI|nr:hypothetical protein CJ030_MR0G006575 [Morella rubra]KAB1203274.1 hypothetical protein CJ030_MR8G026868 [Morella rubra]